MVTIQKIQPLSAMRIAGLLYGALGLLLGFIFGLVTMLFGTLDKQSGTPAWFGYILGPLAMVFIPLFYGALGAAMAGLGAVLYNITSRYVGGVEIELTTSSAKNA